MKKHFKKKATKATKKHDQRHKKTPIENSTKTIKTLVKPNQNNKKHW